MIRGVTEEAKAAGFEVMSMAFLGVAASNIDGFTINSCLSIPIANNGDDKSGGKRLEEIKGLTLTNLQAKFRNCKIIVIDEISMVDAALLGKVNKRLQQIFANNLDWGGLGVICLGDFFQLPPTSGTSLFSAVLALKCGDQVQKDAESAAVVVNGKKKKTAKSRNDVPNLFVMEGAKVFSELQKFDLTQQERADCTEQAERVARWRDIDSLPITQADIDAFKRQQLNRDFYEADPELFNAPILVTGNRERLGLNLLYSMWLACRSGGFVVAWRNPVSLSKNAAGEAQVPLSHDELEDLYATEDNLWNYFVQGANCQVLENQNLGLRLANGSPGIFHSLTLDSSAENDKFLLDNAATGTVVYLEQPPLSVNVLFEKMDIAEWGGC